MHKHLGTSWSPVFSSGENSKGFSREDLGIALHGDPPCLNVLQTLHGRKQKKKGRQAETMWEMNGETFKLGFGVGWQRKPDSWQLLKIGFWVAKGPLTNPVVVFHMLCDGVASICNLAHCHASFGREEYGRVWGHWACYWESFFLFLFFVGLLIYTCLCCEPNLYLKSWYSLSIFYFILLYLSWIVILM